MLDHVLRTSSLQANQLHRTHEIVPQSPPRPILAAQTIHIAAANLQAQIFKHFCRAARASQPAQTWLLREFHLVAAPA
jgi:hypothetical protein